MDLGALEHIYEFLTVQELCNNATVCKLFNLHKAKYSEWITKYLTLAYCNPIRVLLSLHPHDVQKEYKRREIISQNIKNESYEYIKQAGISAIVFNTIIEYNHVVLPLYGCLCVYNLETAKKILEVPNISSIPLENMLTIIQCDEKYVVAFYYDRVVISHNCSVGVWAWTDLLAGNINPLRFKELDFAPWDICSLIFSASQDRIIIVQKKLWYIVKFSDLEFCAKHKYKIGAIGDIKMYDDTILSVRNEKHYDICLWQLQKDDTAKKIWSSIPHNKYMEAHIDKLNFMVLYKGHVDVHDRSTLQLVMRIPCSSAEKTFAANSLLGIICFKESNAGMRCCTMDGKTIFEEKEIRGYQTMFKITNDGTVVYGTQKSTLMWKLAVAPNQIKKHEETSAGNQENKNEDFKLLSEKQNQDATEKSKEQCSHVSKKSRTDDKTK